MNFKYKRQTGDLTSDLESASHTKAATAREDLAWTLVFLKKKKNQNFQLQTKFNDLKEIWVKYSMICFMYMYLPCSFIKDSWRRIECTYCDFRGSIRAVTTPFPWSSERSTSSVAMLVSTQQALATASSRGSAKRWIKVSTPFSVLTSLLKFKIRFYHYKRSTNL